MVRFCHVLQARFPFFEKYFFWLKTVKCYCVSLSFRFHAQVSAQLQAVTSERDAATREVAELRRRIAEDRPTQEAAAALQVCINKEFY